MVWIKVNGIVFGWWNSFVFMVMSDKENIVIFKVLIVSIFNLICLLD